MRMLAGILAGQPFPTELCRRRVAVAPPDAAGHRAAGTDGRADRRDRRPCAAHHSWHRPSRDHLSARVTERPGQERRALRRPSCGRDHVGHRTNADARPHRARAQRVRVGRPPSGHDVSSPAGSGRPAQTLSIPGDFSSAAFWMVAAAALPGSRVEIDDVGLNPTRHRPRRRAASVRRARGRSGSVDRGRRSARHGDCRRRSDGHGRYCARRSARPDRRAPGDRGARGARRRGERARRRRAARQGKRSHRGARRRLPRARHRGRRTAGWISYPRLGRPAGGVADAHGDHRMAMAFAIAALAARQPSRIDGSDAVAISYPGFFETLERLVA